MRVIALPETVLWIRDRGGLLFVWPVISWGPRLVLRSLECSVFLPRDALDFDRVEVEPFMIFFRPGLASLPEELWVEIHGQLHPHLRAYWNGLTYAA